MTLPDPGPEAAASGQNQWAKIKTFYRSCEDTAAIQRQGYTPAVEFLHNTFGRHLDPALPDTGDLTEVIAGDTPLSSDYSVVSSLVTKRFQ